MSEPRDPRLRLPPAAALPPSLKARVLADAPRLGPKLPAPIRPAMIIAGALVWLAVFTLWHGRRDNWSDLPASGSWMVLGEIALAAALSTVVTLSRGSLMLGQPVRRVLWALTVPLVAAGVVMLFVPNARPTPVATFWKETLACDAGVGLAAIPVLALLVYGLRGRILAAPALVGAASGVAAATWGHAIFHWGCPWTDLEHVLYGHVAPAVPLAILGALFAKWLNRLRSVGPRGKAPVR